MTEAASYIERWKMTQKGLLKEGADCAYLYAHVEGDTDEPFYIGMGETFDRPWQRNRTNKHKNRANKHGMRVHVEATPNLTWENALWWEVRWIKAFRDAGYDLVNLTDGGDDQPMKNSEVRTIHKSRVARGDSHYTRDKARNHPMTLPHVKESHKKSTTTEEFKEKQRNRVRNEGNPMDRPGAKERHAKSVSSESFKKKQRDRILIEGNILDCPRARENYDKATRNLEYKERRLKSAPRGETHYMHQNPEAGVVSGKRLQKFLTPEKRVENAKKGWEKRHKRNQYWGA